MFRLTGFRFLGGLVQQSIAKAPINRSSYLRSRINIASATLSNNNVTQYKLNHPMESYPITRGLSFMSTDRFSANNNEISILSNNPMLAQSCQLTQTRSYYAKNSKIKYLDFRYKMPTGHIRKHLLIVRRQKMKKHQKRKWRRKFKCVLAKARLKREIAKEKAFRVELLTMIRRAEQFDPRQYALRKVHEKNSAVREKSKEEKFDELKELIRVNRYQTHYIKPKHRRLESFGLIEQTYQEFAAR